VRYADDFYGLRARIDAREMREALAKRSNFQSEAAPRKDEVCIGIARCDVSCGLR